MSNTLTPYQQRVKEQHRQWAEGIPVHNNIDDECCPDFSCCMPDCFQSDSSKRWADYSQKWGAN